MCFLFRSRSRTALITLKLGTLFSLFFLFEARSETRVTIGTAIKPFPEDQLLQSPVNSYCYLFVETAPTASRGTLKKVIIEEDGQRSEYQENLAQVLEVFRGEAVEHRAEDNNMFRNVRFNQGSLFRLRIPLQKKKEEIEKLVIIVIQWDTPNIFGYYKISFSPEITSAAPLYTNYYSREATKKWVAWKRTLLKDQIRAISDQSLLLLPGDEEVPRAE
jgi:hypothetical protein